MKNNASLGAIIGAAFIVLAVGGSIVTSKYMNKTADDHGMSAGRAGDARPNLNQEQDAASARGGKSPAPTSSSSQ